MAKSKGIRKSISSYNVNYIEKLDINTTYIGELYLTEQFVYENSTNQNTASSAQPIDTLDSDSSQSDEADISNKSFNADTIFLPKPNEDNGILVPSDPDAEDSEGIIDLGYEVPETSTSEETFMDTGSVVGVEAVEVSD